jgi:hypothetical protein
MTTHGGPSACVCMCVHVCACVCMCVHVWVWSGECGQRGAGAEDAHGGGGNGARQLPHHPPGMCTLSNQIITLPRIFGPKGGSRAKYVHLRDVLH